MTSVILHRPANSTEQSSATNKRDMIYHVAYVTYTLKKGVTTKIWLEMPVSASTAFDFIGYLVIKELNAW